MKEIRRCPDFVWFLFYIVAVISIFLQGCSTWWVPHSYYTIPLHCQYFANFLKKCKEVFAFMLKFYVFALLMHFMNRFCYRLWASILTNIFTLMKIFSIFKGNIQKSDISRKIKFRKICNL